MMTENCPICDMSASYMKCLSRAPGGRPKTWRLGAKFLSNALQPSIVYPYAGKRGSSFQWAWRDLIAHHSALAKADHLSGVPAAASQGDIAQKR
jgi:hypothetical protein